MTNTANATRTKIAVSLRIAPLLRSYRQFRRTIVLQSDDECDLTPGGFGVTGYILSVSVAAPCSRSSIDPSGPTISRRPIGGQCLGSDAVHRPPQLKTEPALNTRKSTRSKLQEN